MNIPADKSLILFDGYCHLCSGSVQYLLKYDRKGQFLFSPLSGEIGKKMKSHLAIPTTIDSIILIENNRFYTQSEAILKIHTWRH